MAQFFSIIGSGIMMWAVKDSRVKGNFVDFYGVAEKSFCPSHITYLLIPPVVLCLWSSACEVRQPPLDLWYLKKSKTFSVECS